MLDGNISDLRISSLFSERVQAKISSLVPPNTLSPQLHSPFSILHVLVSELPLHLDQENTISICSSTTAKKLLRSFVTSEMERKG